MSQMKKVKYLLDIDSGKMINTIDSIYSLIEIKFQEFIKEQLKNITLNTFEFKSDVEFIIHIIHGQAPKCSQEDAIVYANKYITNYIDEYTNIQMLPIIEFMRENHEELYIEEKTYTEDDLYSDFMLLINKIDNILALKILQKVIIYHIILVNNNSAYNDIAFANNMYSLVIILCSKITNYNFYDKYSGVKFPYEYMTWIYRLQHLDKINDSIINYERYMTATVTIGLIEYILEYINNKTVIIHK